MLNRPPLTLLRILSFLHVAPMREVGRERPRWTPTLAQAAAAWGVDEHTATRELERLVATGIVERVAGDVPAFRLPLSYEDAIRTAEAKGLDLEEVVSPERVDVLRVLEERRMPCLVATRSNARELCDRFANDVGAGDLVLLPRNGVFVVVYRGRFYPPPWRGLLGEVGRKGASIVGSVHIEKSRVAFESDDGRTIDLLAGRLG